MVDSTYIPKNRLRELREERKLTQAEVAVLTQKAQNTVSRHETSVLPLKADDIERYCKLYKVEPHELFIPAYNEVEVDTLTSDESL